MAETQEHGALFFFATNEPPTVAAIDDDIYVTVTTAVPDLQTRSRRSISSYRRIRQGGHRQLSTAVITSHRYKAC
jgi:hypothetical protein